MIERAFKRGFGRTVSGESGPLLIRGTASDKAQLLESSSGGKRTRGRTGKRWCAALGAVGFIGATVLSEEEKKEQIQSDLREFRRLLKFYEKKEPVIAFIEKLAKDSAINEMDEYKTTPLSLIIRMGLNEDETVEILTAMIEHGAIPGEDELKNAFGLTRLANIPSESAQFVAYWSDELNPTPKNNVLRIILPHYDQKTLSNLIDLAENKIIKLNNRQEETLSQERDYEKQLNKLLEWKKT